MSQFTIDIKVTAVSAAELLVDLQSIVAGLGNGPALAAIQQQLHSIEEKLMTQNESIAALKAANDALKQTAVAGFQQLGDALTNIKADEAAIIAKLGQMGDLSAENQAIVDGVIADAQALAISIQQQADAAKAVADSIPDEPAQP